MVAMKLLLPLFLALLLAAPLHAAEPTATDVLKDLVGRQRVLLAAAEKAEDAAAMEAMRPQFQQLVYDYERYLKDYPGVAAGYVSYALLLGNPALDEQRRAGGLLLKANQLDPDQPLVKNQLGKYLAEEGQPLEAVNYFLAAIRLEPKEPLYHYQLGQLLTEARDDFLKSGQWNRAALDQAMHDAFAQAAALAPDSIPYAYRYNESFYDLEKPDWDGALKAWRALEGRVAPGVEQQTIRLQEANVLLKQAKFAEARTLLGTVDAAPLQAQKGKLLAQLPEASLVPAPAADSVTKPGS